MTVTVTNVTQGVTANESSSTVTLGWTATAGRTLVALLATGASSPTPGTPTDFTLAQAATGSPRTFTGRANWKLATGGETSVSWSLSGGSTTTRYIILELDGLDTSSPFDKSAEDETYINTSTTSIATGTTEVLAQASSYALSAFFVDVITEWDGRSYTNGSTELYVEGGTGVGIIVAGKSLSSTSAFSETLSTSDGGDEAFGCVLIFKQSAGDSTPPVITGPGGATGSTSSVSIAENTTAVHTFAANESVTWSLNGGADAALFSINSSTGALSFLAAPDYEDPQDADTNNQYAVIVRATDAATNTTDQTVTVTVTDATDETAPTLSAPLFSATGSSTGTASVSTNEANGTLYCVVTTEDTAPTKAQVKAGQDYLGLAAAYASSQAIDSTGSKNFNATGLAGLTPYFAHFMHEDAAANQSDVASDTTGDTTDAAVERLGVRLRLYNGSTASTSVTGLSACWWDATTPHTFGAPDYSTNAAETDGVGDLELDLDAVTALAVGDYGCLLVYKADGADVQDSLAFFGQVQILDLDA